MAGAVRSGAMVALGLALLAGCAMLPPPDRVDLAPVPGVALPYKARVMIYAGRSELDRKLLIQMSRFQTEESEVKDGEALARSARVVLAKGFQQVEINDPTIRPQLVVKLIGKGTWNRQDAKIKVGCALDVWTADGIPLGSFPNRYDSPESDYRYDLDAAYALCLKKPVEDLLRSPGLATLAGAGFKDPPVAAADAWIRTLGPIPRSR